MTLDMGWSRRIKEAIEHDRFAIAQQPQVDTRTRAVASYEVLIRMRDSNNELVMPGGFLAAAERFGLAVDLDRWMIVHAIATLVEQRRHTPDLCYAINLSGQSFSDLRLCDLIQEQLASAGLPASALIFEITETAAIADMTLAEQFLGRLRTIGCRTALDDFGSGMSSFAYLKDLPVDIVKIDGRFVKNLAHNPVDQAMVKAMNEIAHALGKKTIAEFVENEESFELLVRFGVDYAQGYHLGRPEVVWPAPLTASHDVAQVAHGSATG
jgi:EAL domain-containing protein (putative c-di-GMP-specific phosphodiesterase class I)